MDYNDFINNSTNSNITQSNINNDNYVTNNIILEYKQILNKFKISKKENEQLKLKINNLENENDKIKRELNLANNIICNLNNNSNNFLENNNIINNFKDLLQIKNKEINYLKNKLNNITNNKKLVNFDDIMVINFHSVDQQIKCGIKCLKDEIFAEVEERLYKQYEDYRGKNLYFLVDARMVSRTKKISENKIKDGDKIFVNINEV